MINFMEQSKQSGDEYKILSEYKNYSEVPLAHPDVKFRCMDPGVYCIDACGSNGCLAIDNESCQFMVNKSDKEVVLSIKIFGDKAGELNDNRL